MNDAPPPPKRQRIDPNAMDDDELPPKGQSILGKRKRNINNNSYYNNENGALQVEQGAPLNHPRNGDQFMNPEQKDDEPNQNMMNAPQPKVVDFQKGHSLDIKITDEHQETFWTTGTICQIQQDTVN